MTWASDNRARGLTMVEATMAMLLVSLLLVAAMRAAAASGLAQYKTAERSTARHLADGLISEITALSYEDPDSTPVFGIESGESSTSKAAWDDVDDFNGWVESTPQARNGVAMADLNGWQRSAIVHWVSALNPEQPAAGETGAKRITVSVQHNKIVVATRVAIRTKAP
jgi:hypothetical protein